MSYFFFRFPQIAIVTPFPGDFVASGLARPGVPNPGGSAFVINLAAQPGLRPLLVKEGASAGAVPPAPNPNFPGLTFTFNTDFITPAGHVFPAGTNLAGLFQFSGSDVSRFDQVTTTFFWFVGGSFPTTATRVTMTATITNSGGMTSLPATRTVSIIPGISGDSLTPNP